MITLFLIFLMLIPYSLVVLELNWFFDVYLILLPVLFLMFIVIEIYLGGYKYYLLSYTLKLISNPSINRIKLDVLSSKENCVQFENMKGFEEYVLKEICNRVIEKPVILLVKNVSFAKTGMNQWKNITIEDKRGVFVAWGDNDVTIDPLEVVNLRIALNYGKQRRSRRRILK